MVTRNLLKEQNVIVTADQYETEFSLAGWAGKHWTNPNNCANLCLKNLQISAGALRQKKVSGEWLDGEKLRDKDLQNEYCMYQH